MGAQTKFALPPLPPSLAEALQRSAVLGLVVPLGGPLARLVDEARRLQEEELSAKLRRVRCEYCGVRVLAHKGTCSQCGAALPNAELQRLIELAERLEARRPPEIRPDPATMGRVVR